MSSAEKEPLAVSGSNAAGKRPDAIPGASATDWAVGEGTLGISDLVRLAKGEGRAILSEGAQARISRSAEVFAKLHARGDAIYGVTTSVGGSVGTAVPKAQSADLSLNVLRMHGCGFGRILDEVEASAVILVRLSSLSHGMSGIRLVVAERLVELLDRGILPQIPSEGSVGASGDLTPLSYVAALLVGEREVFYRGESRIASEVLEEVGLPALRLDPKEALALMNGTSVATAIACLAWDRARRLARVASSVAAATTLAIDGNATHFDARIHAAKPHAGQKQAADWIRADLEGMPSPGASTRLQDRYSVRCAPHVIGVLVDSLSWAETLLETELNGVSDNPIVDVEAEEVLHGGNFYGGHVAQACDSLKTAVASVACLLDRQVMLLCHPEENGGLPTDLVGVEGPEACAHNGFKAATIAASSMAAEAMKLTMPASAFSRSTELHNQDKVPMATTAARDLLRMVELAEQVLSIALLATCQAMDLRGLGGEGALAEMRETIRAEVPRVVEDRRMDLDWASVLAMLRGGRLG
ncbi:MAG: histidine ammonia-lyase [Myxococcota bacterium]